MDVRKKAYFYLVMATAGWGSLYVAGKYVLDIIPSMSLVFFRYVIGVAVLLIIFRKQPRAKIARGDWKYLILIGLLGYFVAIACQFIGTHLCSASMASLINAMNPLVIILLAIPVLGEKANRYQWIAIGITLVGAAVIIGNIQGGSQMLGVIVSCGSLVFWSLTSVLVRKACQQYDSATVTIYGMCMALVCDIPIFVYDLYQGNIDFAKIDGAVIFCVIWIGVVCTAGALYFWNRALELIAAATCSLFYPLQPLTSALLGILILGEVLTRNFILGSGLIIVGILYAFAGEKLTAKWKSRNIGKKG